MKERMNEWQNKSVCCIPNSRHVLLLRTFLKRARKPSAGNTLDLLQQPSLEPVRPDLALHQSLPPSLEPCFWTWPSSNLIRNLLQNPVAPDLAAPKPPRPSRSLLQNRLQNRVEPDQSLHQSFPDLLQNLLRNLVRNPVEPDLAAPKTPRPSREPSPGPCWWLCTQASQTFSGTFGTFSGTSLNLTRRLHQCTPELFWAEDAISGIKQSEIKRNEIKWHDMK